MKFEFSSINKRSGEYPPIEFINDDESLKIIPLPETVENLLADLDHQQVADIYLEYLRRATGSDQVNLVPRDRILASAEDNIDAAAQYDIDQHTIIFYPYANKIESRRQESYDEKLVVK